MYMKRTRLCNRPLPNYSRGEEIMNMVTHIVGGALGIVALIGCLFRTVPTGNTLAITATTLYSLCMILLYTISSVYHGLTPSTGKKVLQILDHCTIYLLIAGTYTPIALVPLAEAYPALGWGMFLFQWALAAVAITLTAIDLKKYNVFSMICYIGMGWAILPFLSQVERVLTRPGFLFLLFGGIAYTVGAILYGIGSRKKWFHSLFHIFVVLGSALQLIAVLGYAL